jgi:hypothetical protein
LSEAGKRKGEREEKRKEKITQRRRERGDFAEKMRQIQGFELGLGFHDRFTKSSGDRKSVV